MATNMHENAPYTPSQQLPPLNDQMKGCLVDMTKFESKATILKNRLFIQIDGRAPLVLALIMIDVDCAESRLERLGGALIHSGLVSMEQKCQK